MPNDTTPAPIGADALREALWICVEHNALHFGETHNTVVQGRAALASAAPASQDAEDAARYRYLKSIAVQTADPRGPIFSIVIRRIDQDGVWGNVSATIDAHIAAARSAQGESNGRD